MSKVEVLKCLKCNDKQKHIVKQTVKTYRETSSFSALDASVTRWLRIWGSGPFVGLCRVNVSFLVPCAGQCARLSPD